VELLDFPTLIKVDDKNMRLKDKVALITGASKGIGREIALTFAREGSNVIVNYSKNKDKANEVVNEIIKMGRTAICIQANVGEKDEVLKMVEEGTKNFRKIDILVNNAGIRWKTPNILLVSDEEWKNALGVNLLGTYYCVQAAAPFMINQRYGKIINISSIGGIGTTSGASVAYATSKSAVIILTRRVAYELGKYNINVNAIAPGMIKTDMPSVGRSKGELEKILKEKTRLAALRRIGKPKDIANVALFLASEESSFITGQVIVVDGGRFDYLSHGI
jgi:3-oxoacyl-[acyl-carrier protein] reductase